MKSIFSSVFVIVVSFSCLCLGNPQSTANELFGYINLDDPQLYSVKQLYQSGDYSQALEAYKDIFLQRADEISLLPLHSYNTNADNLLNNNIVRIYNLAGGYEVQDIGEPGSIDWFIVTDFNQWEYYLSNMSWIGCLIDKYNENPNENAAYLEKWVDIWFDFAENNFHQWDAIRGTPQQDLYGPAFINIWLHRLVLADRAKYLLSQISTAMSVDPQATKSIIDGEQFARILIEMAKRNMPRLHDTVLGGVPNQVISSSLALMQSGLCYVGFNSAQDWEDRGKLAAQNYLEYAYMVDGTDMEQSFNYNGAMIDVGREIIELYMSTGQGLPLWVSDFEYAMLNRFRFLASIVRPNGMLPGMRLQSDADAYNRLSGYQEFLNDSLAAKIIDNTWSLNPSLPAPAFNSIYFPYGGYITIRDGWDNNANHFFMKNSRMGRGHYDESGNSVQITAFGRTMLIDSGGGLYVPDYRNDYFFSSFAHNTIVVDGKSQAMGGQHSPAYTTTIDSRYNQSSNFVFAEGNFGDGYVGGYGDGQIEITDVTHNRQVTFVKDAGVYIFADYMLSPNTRTYTQIWNFDKEYDRTNVILAAPNKIMTNQSYQPNVAIYNFFPSTLSYTRYHGFYDGENVFGWAREGAGYVPAVDTHRSWTGTGDQLLVTLVVPMQRTTEPLSVISQSSSSDITMFEAQTINGINIKYAARKSSGEISLDNITVIAQSLLVKTMPSGEKKCITINCSQISVGDNEYINLGTDFVFNVDVNDNLDIVSNIGTPSSFSWVQSQDGLKPYYQTIEYELTISTEPDYVTSILPSQGVYQVASNTVVNLEAEDFIDCPYVAGFNHWLVDGEIYSTQKTISLRINADHDVKAVFSDDRQCGDICHPIPQSDLNADCRVDIEDLKILVSNWLESSL